MAIAITVKYYGCTNHRPSRLKVSAHGKKTCFYSAETFWDTPDSSAAHHAMQRFLSDYFPHWTRDWIEGQLDDNTTVFVIRP